MEHRTRGQLERWCLDGSTFVSRFYLVLPYPPLHSLETSRDTVLSQSFLFYRAFTSDLKVFIGDYFVPITSNLVVIYLRSRIKDRNEPEASRYPISFSSKYERIERRDLEANYVFILSGTKKKEEGRTRVIHEAFAGARRRLEEKRNEKNGRIIAFINETCFDRPCTRKFEYIRTNQKINLRKRN